jgi:hypothetical protein
MNPKQPPGPLMKKLVIVLMAMIISASANAENCFNIDGEHSVTATLSGRITNAVQFSARLRNSEGRAAEGLYLALDTPLRVDAGSGCTDWSAIPVFMEPENQLAKWRNRHVAILGKLDRFASGLVYPPIFITVTTIKGN